MHEVEKPDEEVGNSQEIEIGISQMFPGIPGDDEDGKGNDDAEDLHQAVEEEIITEAHIIEGDKSRPHEEK